MAQANGLLGYTPKGLSETLDGGYFEYGSYPDSCDFLIQWLKQRPQFHRDVALAISANLIKPLPIDVITARKHLSKEAVELGLLGFSEVYASLQTLLNFIEGLEKDAGDVT